MGRLNSVLTPEDLKRGELVEPSWYPVQFYKYEEKDAESDGSCNAILHFKILKDGPAKGVSVQRLFNEKAMGFGKALWKTWGFPADAQGNVRVSADMIESKLNSTLMVYIKRGKSNKGNEFNDVQDFKPVEKA